MRKNKQVNAKAIIQPPTVSTINQVIDIPEGVVGANIDGWQVYYRIINDGFATGCRALIVGQPEITVVDIIRVALKKECGDNIILKYGQTQINFGFLTQTKATARDRKQIHI